MSRIGKVPVTLPDKTECKVNGAQVSVKGPKGQMEYTFTDNVKIELKDNTVIITPVDDSKLSRSLWGTTRTLISNMVVGVSAGFERKLEINGVGYKAAVKGNIVEFNLGYSHPINYELPKGIAANVERNVVTLSGCNKELLGFVASKIRSFRPPEPYKGKGVKYVEERIIRKAGKSGAK